MIHPSWIVCDAEIEDPVILQGPRQDPQVPTEDRIRAEGMALAANVHARLLDLESELTVSFATKFLEVLDRGSLHELPVVQDPPISRPRGRPRKSTRNTFNGNPSLLHY